MPWHEQLHAPAYTLMNNLNTLSIPKELIKQVHKWLPARDTSESALSFPPGILGTDHTYKILANMHTIFGYKILGSPATSWRHNDIGWLKQLGPRKINIGSVFARLHVNKATTMLCLGVDCATVIVRKAIFRDRG